MQAADSVWRVRLVGRGASDLLVEHQVHPPVLRLTPDGVFALRSIVVPLLQSAFWDRHSSQPDRQHSGRVAHLLFSVGSHSPTQPFCMIVQNGREPLARSLDMLL